MRTVASVLRAFDWHFTLTGQNEAVIVLDRALPVFDGHFPDRPVLPGVCLVDLADRAAQVLGLVTGTPLVVERARFTGAALPGDRLRLHFTRDRNSLLVEITADDGDRCRLRLGYGASAWT
ncbi:hypothetical protein AB0M36_07755 [Actinoplanes sp. NPDC051346]|uniref:ApeI family dehydratase n=1 Tax=Actinoplanes sp. NPDC051346 TaxID=3155048 RepID=UPI003427013A